MIGYDCYAIMMSS